MATLLERRQLPARRRIDVDAYHKMAEAGIIGPEERVELIEGEIFDMAPIGSDHGGMTNRLTRLAAKLAAAGQAVLSVQGPLRLDRYSEPQPDLMLLRPRADDYRYSHPTAADVLLLVEVANTSLAHDRGPKLALYARHGVPEVWIVDLAGQAVEIYREPAAGEYKVRQRHAGGVIDPAVLPELAIDVAGLFA